MSHVTQKYIHGNTAVKIGRSIEEAIRAGTYVAGTILPPVRDLAAALGVSPATVAAAYRALQARGLLVADGRRGTRVSHRSVIQTAAPAPLPPKVRNLRDGNPDPELLPDMAKALREIDPSPRLYGMSRNDPSLIRIAARDFANDGIPAGPISMINGALDGLERVLREHLRPGDSIAIEDPAFGSIVDLFTSLGMIPEPFDIDDEGPIPDDLERAMRNKVQAVFLTPRAQNPTGAAITPKRADELRRVLHRFPHVLIIEDDHASLVCDAPAVTVVDEHTKRWAVVRSMSKALNPDLRLALLTGDRETMNRVEDRLVVGERWVSHVLQRIVAHLLSDKTVRKQLTRATQTYSHRRMSLLNALAAKGIDAHGRSGFNVWVPVREETPTVQGLLNAGWAVTAGERFRIRSAPAIRITASTLEPAEAISLAGDLAQILARDSRTAAA